MNKKKDYKVAAKPRSYAKLAISRNLQIEAPEDDSVVAVARKFTVAATYRKFEVRRG